MNRQILVIDDSQKIHQLVGAILANEPVDIRYASEAKYGIVLAASLRPDLILLDVNMAGIDGFEACRQLKADPETAKCPIIFLTAQASTEEKVEGFKLGAVDYVTKPFNAAELKARVHAALQTRGVISSLEHSALIDPETKLGNRLMFDQRLNAEVGVRSRLNNALSVIVLEVVELPAPAQGPAAPLPVKLRHAIGEVFIEVCRPEDVACWLGEAFAIIAPHTTAAEAAALAEQISKRIAQIPLAPAASTPSLAGQQPRLAAYFGVAEALVPYDRSMLERADDAMYETMQRQPKSAPAFSFSNQPIMQSA